MGSYLQARKNTARLRSISLLRMVFFFLLEGKFNFRKWFQPSSSVGYISLNKSDYKLVPNDFSIIKLV